nr:MAG TPA: hypothetical protein [Caudoviricetes sp.]
MTRSSHSVDKAFTIEDTHHSTSPSEAASADSSARRSAACMKALGLW